jgi:hypothetical protein
LVNEYKGALRFLLLPLLSYRPPPTAYRNSKAASQLQLTRKFSTSELKPPRTKVLHITSCPTTKRNHQAPAQPYYPSPNSTSTHWIRTSRSSVEVSQLLSNVISEFGNSHCGGDQEHNMGNAMRSDATFSPTLYCRTQLTIQRLDETALARRLGEDLFATRASSGPK